MVKVKLQGKKNEVRRMLKLLQKNPRCNISYISDFMRCDNEKYHRIYLGVYPVKRRKMLYKELVNESEEYGGSELCVK